MGNQNGNCYSTAGETENGEMNSGNQGLVDMEINKRAPMYKTETIEPEPEPEVEFDPIEIEETKTLYNGKIIRGVKVNGQIKKGTIEYPNGDKYEGEIMGDMAFGQGEMNYQNGDWYTGNFEQDKKSGWGKLVLQKGNVYKGNFKDDKFEGEGEFQFKNGNSYVGKRSNSYKE